MKHGPEHGDAAASGQGLARLGASIEAVLITSPRAVSAERIAAALGLTPPTPTTPTTHPAGQGPESDPAPGAVADAAAGSAKRVPRRKPQAQDEALALVRRGVEWLNGEYAQTGRSFRIEAVAGGYRIVTLAEHRGVIEAVQGLRAARALSKPAIETLAIIAYRQPISRAGIEAIRGVACGEVVKSLTERRLVTVVGRAEEIGRPLLYGTTKAFLEAFGLASIKDLPSEKELGGLGQFVPGEEHAPADKSSPGLGGLAVVVPGATAPA